MKGARRTRGAANKSDVENLEVEVDHDAAVMAKRLSPISPAEGAEGAAAATTSVVGGRAVRKRGKAAEAEKRLDALPQAKKKPLSEGNAQAFTETGRPQRKAASKASLREDSEEASDKRSSEEEDFQPSRKKKSASKPPRPLPMSSSRISMAGPISMTPRSLPRASPDPARLSTPI